MVLVEAQPTELLGEPLQVTTKDIGPGCYYAHWKLDTTATDQRWSIHMLSLNLDSMSLALAIAMDQVIGQETVSAMVQRKGALAGINGGFSFSNDPWNIHHGDPRDFLMKNGQVVSEPILTRASFGWVHKGHQQIPILARMKWEAIAVMGTDTMTIDGINRQPQPNETIWYDRNYHISTLTNQDRIEFWVDEKQQIRSLFLHGSNHVPSLGGILSLPKTYRRQDEKWKHTKIEFRQHVEAAEWIGPGGSHWLPQASFHTAGPILMIDGQPVDRMEVEQIPASFATTRHPRTGVGISKDLKMLWLVVVDGRQPALSVGMSLPEFTSVFQALGAWHAYNLDGGGSSTMVIKGQIVNSPSDPKERRRCDALLIFPK